MDNLELNYRKEIARELLAGKIEIVDGLLEVDQDFLAMEAELTALAGLEFPAGLAPIPDDRMVPQPSPEDPLPKADILVITWTVAEQNALADVLTPRISRNAWYRYRHNFDAVFATLIKEIPQPPSRASNRLGSWYPATIGNKKIICFKSELHLNQDGIWLDENREKSETKTGFATLPVKDLLQQLIKETEAQHVITVGTAGATFVEHGLGDVVVTRAVKFRLSDEFERETFNNKVYVSDWKVPEKYFDHAEELMSKYKKNLQEPSFTTPTKRFQVEVPAVDALPNNPAIHLDGNSIPKFHPILTTDFFEFGTSANNLEETGAAVEMGDAVLGLVCSEMVNSPKWLVIRNVSDPQINADLPTVPAIRNMQIHWAVWYYEQYGYWTSVNSALATWAVIAGLSNVENA
jgi:nucleoside phosphorylase